MIEVHEKHIDRIVRWKSQARGSVTETRGRIIGIAREGQVPIVLANKNWPDHKRLFDSCLPIQSGKERYFVEIKHGYERPLLYCPYTRNLEFYP